MGDVLIVSYDMYFHIPEEIGILELRNSYPIAICA